MLLLRKGESFKEKLGSMREKESLTLMSSSGFEFDSSSESMNAKEPRFVGIPFCFEVDPFLMNLIFFCFKALPYYCPVLTVWKTLMREVEPEPLLDARLWLRVKALRGKQASVVVLKFTLLFTSVMENEFFKQISFLPQSSGRHYKQVLG